LVVRRLLYKSLIREGNLLSPFATDEEIEVAEKIIKKISLEIINPIKLGTKPIQFVEFKKEEMPA